MVYQGQRCIALIDRYSQGSSDLLVGEGFNRSKAIAHVQQRTVLPAGQRKKITYRVEKDRLQVLVDGDPATKRSLSARPAACSTFRR